MKIRIEYVAQMKVAAGTAAEEPDLPDGATAQEAVRAVADRHGGKLAQLLLDEHGVLCATALVFVDENQLDWDVPLPLRKDARITVLAPLAGG